MQIAKFHPVIFHILVCAVLLLGIVIFQSWIPVAYIYFISEDSWVEYGTFVFYLLTAFLILWAIQKDNDLRRPGYILLCLGLFFVAMEEISWGQRFFGIRTPQVIAQFNQQSELSLHNASFFPAEHLFFYAILIWAVILPEISCRFVLLERLIKQVGIPLTSRKIYPYFILGFFLKNSQIVIGSPELGELLIGLGFFLFAVDARVKVNVKLKKIDLSSGRFTGFLTMTILTATAAMVLLGPQDIYALKRKLHKSARTDYPQRRMYAQAKTIFEYLIQHKELKNDDTLFQYGLFLKDIESQDEQVIFLRALQETKDRMRLSPEKPGPNVIAGKIYKQLNQIDLAQKEFTEALRKDQIRFDAAHLNWQRTDALKSMGEIYIEMGKYDLAREQLQKAFDYAEGGRAKRGIKDLLKTIDF